ncbi:MAG: hypothetical protein ACR2NA_08230 [Solirubrobacterales bacterium]
MSAAPARVAEAILTGKQPQCPRFRGFWAFSEGTENAYPQRCGRWDCEHCVKFKKAAARIALARGVDHELRQGRFVRFVTLTDGHGALTVADWTRAWKRLSLRLSAPRKGRKGRNRSGRLVWRERPRPAYLREAAVALEAHRSGALHAHVLLLGEFIPQRWLSHQARAVGLGKIVHITALHPSQATRSDALAEYLTPGATAWENELGKMTAAAYLTAKKHGLAPVAARSQARVRPLRFTRGWPAPPGPDGPMTKAHRDLVAALFADQPRDPGPFEMWSEAQLCEELADARAAIRAALSELAAT